MDGDVGLALQTMLAQQQSIAQDISVLRADVGKALTRIEVIDGRTDSAGVVLTDHEARLRLLERFRYTLAGLSIVGGAASGFIGYWIGHVVH